MQRTDMVAPWQRQDYNKEPSKAKRRRIIFQSQRTISHSGKMHPEKWPIRVQIIINPNCNLQLRQYYKTWW